MGKTDAYIGFAVRSNAVIYGQDSVKKSSAVRLVIISSLAADRTKREMARYAQNKKIHLVQYDGSLWWTKAEDCKVTGITNPELSKAILDNLDKGYSILVGGGLNGND